MTYILEQKTKKHISAGNPKPLGATLLADGVNFAVFSQYAKEILLLLFDSLDSQSSDIIKLNKTDNVWHACVAGLKAGQLYGYKANGDYDPANGMRFNPYKLLIDPYAKAITADIKNVDNLIYGYDLNNPDKDLKMDERDNAHIMPKSIVVDDNFDWQGAKAPEIPMKKLIIYETHVKSFTAHQSSGVNNPGTYLGFIEKIPYLKSLGINAVELLPVHQFFTSDRLRSKGLVEYWGYNSIGFFAPEIAYSTRSKSACQVTELKMLIRELHRAGIEVILDVVYNHTGESNELGPTLCLRGIDNPSYYLLMADSQGRPYRAYKNDSWCDNTLRTENPPVLQLVLDSLRYWTTDYHIDGFRFDQCPIIARDNGKFSRDSAFFKAISTDPVLNKVKLIAEPWGPLGDETGNFPKGWGEWNGKFRDNIRKFIRGDTGQVAEMAEGLTGSTGRYNDKDDHPTYSINFITCHDGFTLNDLFSYDKKHNEINQEDNKDGGVDNNSSNCGVEGPTDDANIVALRKKLVKNAISILMFSSGTPMALSGDEVLRTQKGNNNPYCQDNDLNWLNWDDTQRNSEILEFFKKAIAFRKRHPVLEAIRPPADKGTGSKTCPDCSWFDKKLNPPVWQHSKEKILCLEVQEGILTSETGDSCLFMILNAGNRGASVLLPQHEGYNWYRVVDTSHKSEEDFMAAGHEKLLKNQNCYRIDARSVAVFITKKQVPSNP